MQLGKKIFFKLTVARVWPYKVVFLYEEVITLVLPLAPFTLYGCARSLMLSKVALSPLPPISVLFSRRRFTLGGQETISPELAQFFLSSSNCRKAYFSLSFDVILQKNFLVYLSQCKYI